MEAWPQCTLVMDVRIYAGAFGQSRFLKPEVCEAYLSDHHRPPPHWISSETESQRSNLKSQS